MGGVVMAGGSVLSPKRGTPANRTVGTKRTLSHLQRLDRASTTITREPTMRRSILTTSLLVAALALPAGALAVDPPTLITTPMSAEDSEGLDIIANAMLESGDVNALYLGVWDPARGAHVKAYGIADVATGRAASVGDSFRIGSTTKTFTATVILQLVDAGKLTLDATLADAAPGVAAKYPTVADRTIEQLLSMTGGHPGLHGGS